MNEELREAKKHIRKFIRAAWDDQKLAEVYAFNQDGHMSFKSACSCLMGVTFSEQLHNEGRCCDDTHYIRAALLDVQITGHYGLSILNMGKAEWSYNQLGSIAQKLRDPKYLRKIRLSAILRAEIRRRDRIKKASEFFEDPVPVAVRGGEFCQK